MTTLFMILAVAWIVFCFLVLIGIIITIIECYHKIRWGFTILLTVLLFVGISWGFDRVEEIKEAIKDEAPSQSQSE